jgi:hypothetical protein
MNIPFFGALFGSTKNASKELANLPVTPEGNFEDGATVIETGDGAAAHGYAIDMDTNLRSDIDLIRKYREISGHAEIEIAIDDIVNEAISEDIEGKIVRLDLDNIEQLSSNTKKKIIEEFNNILYLLNFNKRGYELFRQWYVDGRLFHYCDIDQEDPRNGIKNIIQIDPLKIKKITEIKKKTHQITKVQTVEEVREYYLYSNYDRFIAPGPNTPVITYGNLTGIRLTADSVSYVNSGLLERNSKRIYGYLHKAIKPLNQLRMIEDAVVIYRITRAPERRIFYIDVGSLPKQKAEQYLREIMNRYRNKVTYDAATGEVRDDRRFMHMLEDYWLPRREGGKGTSIETLPGGQNLGEMEDVKYFLKKLYMSLNIPISRIEADTGFNMGRASEISRDELKYMKFINRLRTKFSEIFLNILRVQLLAKGILNQEDWEQISQAIRFEFSSDSYFTESKNIEMMKERLSILRDVGDYSGKFFSERWIRKTILQMTDDEAEEMQDEIEKERIRQNQLAMNLQSQQIGVAEGGTAPELGSELPQQGGGGGNINVSSLL